ncbi:hypothetical protein GCM10010495_76980 [Kitasatospora herbaricolor]|uniref:hypothetical protein n=1 Tax=Kitasatospora herbaricolor TaxID=68217 RepID=UPI0017497E36|nr:hypothetical protein [Kitasatospora herbaricolor]MDQ0313366.1 hypothetical protein [Kitasatospora herbaricolor]GGV47809.1 hypothetical protein GCM10010495_76980 [Kitasatospora herbaricolor]
MRPLHKIAASAAVTAGVLATSLTGASAAHADSRSGCSYPYACIYTGTGADGSIIAMFRDVTSYYQNTTHETGFSVVNTRNDDTVWVRWTNGPITNYDCLTPNNSIGAIGTITGIRISDSATC